MAYLNLNIPATARLAILKNAADKLNKGHNIRKAQNDATPYTWRDVRYSGFHNARARQCHLSPGLNGGARIWYCHTGQYFGRQKWSDEVLDLRHTGWFENDHGDTIRGLVVALPGGRFLAGYHCTGNGEYVYFSEVYNNERDAARAGDDHAESFAEDCREYNDRYDQATALAAKIDDYRHRLRELVILSRAGLDYASQQMRDVASQIRQARRELATDYAGVLQNHIQPKQE